MELQHEEVELVSSPLEEFAPKATPFSTWHNAERSRRVNVEFSSSADPKQHPQSYASATNRYSHESSQDLQGPSNRTESPPSPGTPVASQSLHSFTASPATITRSNSLEEIQLLSSPPHDPSAHDNITTRRAPLELSLSPVLQPHTEDGLEYQVLDALKSQDPQPVNFQSSDDYEVIEIDIPSKENTQVLDTHSKKLVKNRFTEESSPLFVRTEPNTPALSTPPSLTFLQRGSRLISTPTRSTVTKTTLKNGKADRSISSPTATTASTARLSIDIDTPETHLASTKKRSSISPPPISTSRFKPLTSSSPIFEFKEGFSAAHQRSAETIATTWVDFDDENELFGPGVPLTANSTGQSSAARKTLSETNALARPRKQQRTVDTLELDFEKEIDGIIRHKAVADEVPVGKKLTKKEEREREAKQRRKEREAARAAEKAEAEEFRALNEANKRRSLHKDEALSDLILIFEDGFKETKLGSALCLLLDLHNVKHEVIPINDNGVASSGNSEKRGKNKAITTIKVKRKVTTRYDSEREMFVPINPPCIEPVNTQLRILDMSVLNVNEGKPNFLRKVIGDQHETSNISTTCIIQGFAQLVRKTAHKRNQKVASRVRELMGHQVSTSTVHRRKHAKQRDLENSAGNEVSLPIDTAMLESAFLDLQFLHDWKLIYTQVEDDTVEWLISLLQDLSVKWYKRKDDSEFSENATTEIGHVRSSADPLEITAKSLQQVKLLSAKVASSIVDTYGNMLKLADEFDKNGGRSNIESIQVAGESQSGRPINKNLVKTLELFLSSRNPDQII